MNPKVIIKEIVEDIRTLSLEDLKSLAEYIDFMREKELETELLNSKKMIKAVRDSKRAWRQKKLTEFVAWDSLKKKYNI